MLNVKTKKSSYSATQKQSAVLTNPADENLFQQLRDIRLTLAKISKYPTLYDFSRQYLAGISAAQACEHRRYAAN